MRRPIQPSFHSRKGLLHRLGILFKIVLVDPSHLALITLPRSCLGICPISWGTPWGQRIHYQFYLNSCYLEWCTVYGNLMTEWMNEAERRKKEQLQQIRQRRWKSGCLLGSSFIQEIFMFWAWCLKKKRYVTYFQGMYHVVKEMMNFIATIEFLVIFIFKFT